MVLFPVVFGLLLNVFFWGMGGALLLTPRPWRRFWPVFVAPAGFALQTLVVWGGVYANLPGTNSYAGWSEIIPAVLLLAGLKHCGRKCLGDVTVLRAIWGAMAVCLGVLVLPLAIAVKGLGPTTVSLGSCDAADYAAGARVLMEFAHTDRSGFLGLTEVVSVMSVDNFFDFWLRLNHFTPSALIALNGTVLGYAPHEIISVLTAVLLAASLPVVFWVARAVLGYEGWDSLGIALLYGFSPITWYAVYHVAMGQLLAAMAIGLITWAGVALWRGPMSWRRGGQFAGVLVMGYTLLLGSYNFILLVCFVPALAYAGGLAIWKGEMRRFFRWGLMLLLPLVLCGMVFFERVAGLAERFMLFQNYDFGWRIPLLSPEGWLGMVAGPGLAALPAWLHLTLGLIIVVALGAALIIGAKQQRPAVFMVLCLAVPVLLGYGYLNLRGIRLGTNASYDAYKLLSVFYPELLAALCYWVSIRRRGRSGRHAVSWALVAVVAAANLNAAYRFAVRVENPVLIVGRDLSQLQSIETMPEISSLNMMIPEPDMWSRLWANAFLLRRPQYFSTHTYEGRLNTALRGDWDLAGGLIHVHLPGGGTRQINATYSLIDTHSAYFLRASLGDGWYDLERLPRTGTRWHWTKGNASLHIDNQQARPLRIVCRFNARSLTESDLQLWSNGRLLRTVPIGTQQKLVRLPEITLPPGSTTLELRSSTPPIRTPGDTRLLGFAVYGIDLDVQTDSEKSGP